MTEHEYPPDWNTPPSEADPRLGSILDDYQPDAALRARVLDVARRYLARDGHAASTLLDVAADTMEALTDDHRAVARLLVALLEVLAVHAIGPQGEPLAVGRLAGDLAAARHDVLREAAAQ